MLATSRRARRTLARATETYHGIGLHSGVAAWARIAPAKPGAGLVFVEAGSGQEVPASAENVFDTTRCTQIRRGTSVVQTVEHVLSALAGLAVDDARIEISGGEVPAGDGSAAPFAALILAAGIVEHDGFVEPYVVAETIEVTDGRGGGIRLTPAARTSYRVTLEYPKHSYIGTQAAEFAPVLFSDATASDASPALPQAADPYLAEIAPARTFGFLSEIDALRAAGLGLGASLDNALVLGDDGYVNEPRFQNEMARHKVLDLIGDLALFGRPILGSIDAVRPGHQLNTQLAALLASKVK